MEANKVTCASNKLRLDMVCNTFRYDENTLILADHIKHQPDPTKLADYFSENYIMLDISNPLNIKIKGKSPIKTTVENSRNSKLLFNKKIYCNSDDQFIISDATDPRNIKETKAIRLETAIDAFTVSKTGKIYAISEDNDIVSIDGKGRFNVIGPKIKSNVTGIGWYKNMLLAAGWQHGLSIFDFDPDGTLNHIKTVPTGSSTMPAEMHIVHDRYYFGTDYNHLVMVDLSAPGKAKRLKITKNNRVNMYMNGVISWNDDVLVYGNGDNKCELIFVTPTDIAPVIREVIKLPGQLNNLVLKDNYLINFDNAHIEIIELK
jgi:hypothetical protein